MVVSVCWGVEMFSLRRMVPNWQSSPGGFPDYPDFLINPSRIYTANLRRFLYNLVLQPVSFPLDKIILSTIMPKKLIAKVPELPKPCTFDNRLE